jgi:hypothetical protein
MGARPYDPTTGRFLSVDPIDGGSLNNYDYAGQDAVDDYDLDGNSCKWAGHLGGWLKKKCHAVSSPLVTLRDELKARLSAANASAASEALGGGKVSPTGPLSAPASSSLQGSTDKLVQCSLFVTGGMLAASGGPIEAFETREAVKAGASAGTSILRWGVGRSFLGASGLAFVGSFAFGNSLLDCT